MPKAKPKKSPMKSEGVIVTHREKHISPRNSQRAWLIVMMALIGFVAGICINVMWQGDELAWQFDRMHAGNNGTDFKHWASNYKGKTDLVDEPLQTDIDLSFWLLENFDLYKRLNPAQVKEMQTLFPNCAATTDVASLTSEMKSFDKAIAQIVSSGEIYALPLPGKTMYYTSRPADLTNEVLRAASSCGELGTLGTWDITRTDKIMWVNLSCGGVEVTPEDGQEAYQEFQKCEETVKVLHTYFLNS